MHETISEMPPPLHTILHEELDSVKMREAHCFEQALQQHQQRIVVFGCGGLGQKAASRLMELGVTPLAFCDNNESLWGTRIEGIPAMSVPQAASNFGRDALFLIAVWNPHHWFGETADTLKRHGVRSIMSYVPLYWRFPSDLLQVYLLNDLPGKVYEAKNDVLAAEKLWADALSLHIYRANIYWRALGDARFMPPRPAENTYFPMDIFTCEPQECIVDCGAFDGDTIRQILGRCGECLRAVYALEGDAVSFRKLQSFVASLPMEIQPNIHLIHGAVSSERGTVRFTSDGGTGSHMGYDEGIEIPCYPLDSLDIDAPVTMIKMDIEGAEYGALLGALKIIQRDRPVLAICVYHTQNDIWRLPLLVRQLLPQHKLYLRAYEGDGFQTVLFAIPLERDILSHSTSTSADKD